MATLHTFNRWSIAPVEVRQSKRGRTSIWLVASAEEPGDFSIDMSIEEAELLLQQLPQAIADARVLQANRLER